MIVVSLDITLFLVYNNKTNDCTHIINGNANELLWNGKMIHLDIPGSYW